MASTEAMRPCCDGSAMGNMPFRFGVISMRADPGRLERRAFDEAALGPNSHALASLRQAPETVQDPMHPPWRAAHFISCFGTKKRKVKSNSRPSAGTTRSRSRPKRRAMSCISPADSASASRLIVVLLPRAFTREHAHHVQFVTGVYGGSLLQSEVSHGSCCLGRAHAGKSFGVSQSSTWRARRR